MLNLYFFNSPEFSSVGFRRTAWTLAGETYVETKPDSLNKEAWTALLEGVAEASCFDSGEGTRIFMMRGVKVKRPEKRTWNINFILEADTESLEAWANLSALFILRYKEATERLADLLTVEMTEGERHLLDGAGMYAMTRMAVDEGLAGEASMDPALAGFAPLLNGSASIKPETLWVVVPYVNMSYFYQYTSLDRLSNPKAIISKARWHAILDHTPLPKEDEEAKEERKGGININFEGIPDEALKTIGIISGALLSSALICGVYQVLRGRKNRKGDWDR